MSQTLGFADKVCEADKALARLQVLRHLGPVVFTNGVFDVLHRGHAAYLEQACALGASLVVGVNTDASAKRLGKGPERPLNSQQDRALLLAALASVSLVTWFDEDTPVQLIERLRPDVYVKVAITTWRFCKKPQPCAAGADSPWRSPLSAATPPAPWSRKYKAPQSPNSLLWLTHFVEWQLPRTLVQARKVLPVA